MTSSLAKRSAWVATNMEYKDQLDEEVKRVKTRLSLDALVATTMRHQGGKLVIRQPRRNRPEPALIERADLAEKEVDALVEARRANEDAFRRPDDEAI